MFHVYFWAWPRDLRLDPTTARGEMALAAATSALHVALDMHVQDDFVVSIVTS